MLSLFDSFRDLDLASICLRMILPCICGGLVGIEREFKRRPAGFRTHILICLGAAMTTLTSQYLALVDGSYTDVARLGAQVISGVGFLGAGTIIVTRHRRVKGLTTAAGLWVSAIVGLCIGAGFYEGGIFATLMILLAETVFFRLERYILKHTPEVLFYIEYVDKNCLDRLLLLFQERAVKVLNMELAHQADDGHHNASVIFNLRLHKTVCREKLMEDIRNIDGVVLLEDI